MSNQYVKCLFWTPGMTAFVLSVCLWALVFWTNQPAISNLSYSPALPDCGKEWPLKGTWSYEGQPEEWKYKPRGCQGSILSAERLISCFKGRTLFLFGNSISRQFAFELPRLLYNMSVVPTPEQKGFCKKIGEQPQFCRANLPSPDIKVVHAWLLYLDGLPPKPTSDSIRSEWDIDTCGDYRSYNPDECFTKLIKGHTTRDILIFNMGGIYALSDPVGVPNIMEWRKNLMRRFIQRVQRNFKGRVIYMNISPPQSNEDLLVFPGRYTEERIERINEELVPIVLEEAPEWKIFDIFSLTKPVLYSSLFADSCHFPGHLTRMAWNVLGHMICEM